MMSTPRLSVACRISFCFAVIENLMRSLLLNQFEAFRCPCRAKNLQTHGTRDLERRDALHRPFSQRPSLSPFAVQEFTRFCRVEVKAMSNRAISGQVAHERRGPTDR